MEKSVKKRTFPSFYITYILPQDGGKTPVKKSAKMLNISLLKALLAVHRHVF
jgi:hypothetical protein